LTRIPSRPSWMPIGPQGTFALCKAKEARIALCNEKVSLPPRTDMLVPPGFWRGFFFGPQPRKSCSAGSSSEFLFLPSNRVRCIAPPSGGGWLRLSYAIAIHAPIEARRKSRPSWRGSCWAGESRKREHRLAGRSTTMIAGGDDGRRQGAGRCRQRGRDGPPSKQHRPS
jgi:hypothetical protein